MALNYIWAGFFLAAFVIGLFRLIFLGDWEVFPAMTAATFEWAKTAFELALGLTGVMTLWLGLLKIGESAGAVAALARAIAPFFSRLFPEVPKDHPAMGAMILNFSANVLGLDNAATPLGLKAMKELQSLNPEPDTASNAQILFLVLNTSGLTLIPISVLTYRALGGAANPTDVFLPILLATAVSTLAGLILVALWQRISLWDRVLLTWIAAAIGGIVGTSVLLSRLDKDVLAQASSTFASLVLFTVIVGMIGLGLRRKINVYETFIEGAKEGFQVAVKIIPFLVAMLVGVNVFRAAGGIDMIVGALAAGVHALGWDAQFVDALPTALMKPLSGSGARGLMITAMETHGPDSFAGRLACVFQGSTETTFYVLAVYFGSVSIRRVRYAPVAGLFADLAGVIAAIFFTYLFFG